LHKFWGNLAVQLGKHAGIVGLVGLILTVSLGFGITKLQFATGQDSYLNKNEEVYKDSVAYQDLFGGQAMLTLITMNPGHTVTELFTKPNRAQLDKFQDDVRGSGKVLDVVGATTVMELSEALLKSPSGSALPVDAVAGKAILGALSEQTAVVAKLKKDPKTPAATLAAAEKSLKLRNDDNTATIGRISKIPVAARTLDNPAWVNFILYDNQGKIRKALLTFIPDNRHVQIVTRLKGNEDIPAEGAAADLVKAKAAELKFTSATTVTTGASVLLKNINDYLKGGIFLLGGIAVGIMVVILLVAFDVRWRLLPLGVVLIGVIWAFGLAGYLHIPLTIVTIAGLPVMLGVGIDYAIQMHARVEEEVIIDRSAHPIQETARNLGPALLVVTFDAVFAFAALHFAKTPMIRDFGLLLAVGICAICLNSIIAPLAFLGIREYKSPTKGRDYREGKLGTLVVKLGSIPSKAGPLLVVAAILIFAGGIFTEGKLTLQTDPIQWVNQKSAVIKDLGVIERETHSRDELGIFIQSTDVFDQKTIDFTDAFTQCRLTKPGAQPPGGTAAPCSPASRHGDQLLTANSMVGIVSDLLDVPGATHVAPTSADVKAAYAVAPTDVRKSVVSTDGKAFNVIFRVRGISLEQRKGVVDQIRASTTPPAGVKATPSGLAVVGVGLLKNLESGRVQLTYLAILFVFLFLAVRLRSIVRSLLSLVPVMIAVGTASLVAYVFSLKLSPMTAVGGPLVIAVCTEFTSLILLRFVEERNRGLAPLEAIDVTSARTGRAFIVSGMTAIVGVAVLSASSLPLLRDFGIIVSMNVLVALMSALVVLPPMLVWADKRNWVSRGLIPEENLVGPDGIHLVGATPVAASAPTGAD